MSSLLAGLDVGEGGRVEDAPADVGLTAQIDLIMPLQVAQLSIIVGVAVADDLDGDLLGIAPLEAVDEIAYKARSRLEPEDRLEVDSTRRPFTSPGFAPHASWG